MRRVIVILLTVLFFGVCSDVAEAVLPESVGELQLVETEELAQQTTDFLEQTVAEGEDTRRHSVELVKKPRDFKAPAGEVTFEPFLPYGVRYGTATAVEVMVKIDGKAFRKVRCTYRVHVFDNVVVAINNIQPRQIIAASDLQIAERDVSSINRKYFTDPSKLVGREANRIINSGTIFTTGMIVNPVIIEAGTQIYVVAVVNGVMVKTEAIAMERGREDAVIRVKNIDSGRIMRGRVIDATTVQVL